MEIADLLSAVRRGWWLVLLGLGIGGAAALSYVAASMPVYSAETQLFVSTNDSASTSEALQGSQFSEQRVASYAQLLTGKSLASRVSQQLDGVLTPAQVAKEITAQAVPNTVLLNVTVTDPDPQRARRIAQAVGPEFADMVRTLETPAAGGPSPVKVTVTESPNLPTAPSSPAKTRDIVLGLMVGLFVGCLVAVLRARLDRTVKTPTDVGDLLDVPVMGTVIRDDALATRHVIDQRSSSRASEDYRQLRTNLQFIDVDQPPRVIMVSSPMPSEGKTTVVVNLAVALSEAGRTVTIVEADLRRPRVTRYLGMVGDVGLTNVLAGAADLGEVLQSYGSAGVSVVGAGPTPPNPGQLLASGQMSALVEELRGKSDYVLLDAPPLLPVADSAGLAAIVDGVLLSVRYGKTRKDQFRSAADLLARVGARTLGVIINIVPPNAEITTAYGYGYSYVAKEDPTPGVHRLKS